MSKKAIVALGASLAVGISYVSAQQASGTMSETEMASGTMAKPSMKEGKMKHTPWKKGNSMGMKHEASGATGQ
jgi:hypothetical protein